MATLTPLKVLATIALLGLTVSPAVQAQQTPPAPLSAEPASLKGLLGVAVVIDLGPKDYLSQLGHLDSKELQTAVETQVRSAGLQLKTYSGGVMQPDVPLLRVKVEVAPPGTAVDETKKDKAVYYCKVALVQAGLLATDVEKPVKSKEGKLYFPLKAGVSHYAQGETWHAQKPNAGREHVKADVKGLVAHFLNDWAKANPH